MHTLRVIHGRRGTGGGDCGGRGAAGSPVRDAGDNDGSGGEAIRAEKRKQRKKKQAQEVEGTTAGKDAQNSLPGVGLYCRPSGPEEP